ncbi:hypothetical protein MJO52_05355 [Microbulbifer variabilis]|uniref:Transcriptional regulator n=1 Tax=Microbulbifer variabilis TaxID=266805 RepID=A0ABY4VIA0_9GAMM|nr:hypothetical protein [Microbulbifer variabilis]USD22560.1 hypothetical protein MJO52_05355 [Microbulbifer variabilis]
MTIKKYTKKEIEQMEDLTDYERVREMTEEEIRESAESDPDAPLQSESDLENFKPARRRGENAKNNKN